MVIIILLQRLIHQYRGRFGLHHWGEFVHSKSSKFSIPRLVLDVSTTDATPTGLSSAFASGGYPTATTYNSTLGP